MNILGFAGRPGWLEVTVVIVVLLLLFGAKRLPELARSIGKSLNEFKKGRSEGEAAPDTESSEEKPAASDTEDDSTR